MQGASAPLIVEKCIKTSMTWLGTRALRTAALTNSIMADMPVLKRIASVSSVTCNVIHLFCCGRLRCGRESAARPRQVSATRTRQQALLPKKWDCFGSPKSRRFDCRRTRLTTDPLDGGVQLAQLLRRRRLAAGAALKQAPGARQEAVHPLHPVGAPHLQPVDEFVDLVTWM
jgi:hypothetical protein